MTRFLVLSLVAALTASAEFVKNPDDNTLWREDGKAIEGWREGLTVQSEPNGFRIEAGEKGGATGRYVPLDPEYPWLVWRVVEVRPHAKGYRGWTGPFLSTVGHHHLGQVTQLQEGIFALDVAENPGNWPKKTDFMRMDLHGAALVLAWMQMVRQPADFLQVVVPAAARERGYVQPGDELTFRVTMAKPAEDVSLRFYNSYMMPQMLLNGQQALQLRMDGDNKCVWQATVTLQSVAGGRAGKDGRFAPGSILVKAIILGGGPGTPVWGTAAWPIATTPGD